jgi:hypothetical protein
MTYSMELRQHSGRGVAARGALRSALALVVLGLCVVLPLPGTAAEAFTAALRTALLAPDPDSRALALQAAQAQLEPRPADPAPEPAADDWLAAVEHRVAAMTRATRGQLREALLHQVWASPYAGRLAAGPESFEPMVEALRLLHALQELGGEDPAGLAALQDLYWDWLRAHRTQTGVAGTALAEAPGSPVFAQWVLDHPDRAPEIVQLVGTPQRTLRWEPVARKPIPARLLGGEGLAVDLATETARWLLVLEGPDLETVLRENPLWFAAVSRKARLVLRLEYHLDFAALDGVLEPGLTGPVSPYLLPAPPAPGPRVWLLCRQQKAVVADWPLEAFRQPANRSITGLIADLLATDTKH